MTEIWYSPREFNFSYHQMEWAIPNLMDLEEGRWPVMPPGYLWDLQEQAKTNPDAQRKLNQTIEEMQEYAVLMRRGGHVPAKFERAVEIASEINSRIDRCNENGSRDGAMLLSCHLDKIGNDRLHTTYNLDVSEIGDRIDRVMSYISGWKAKGNYQYWCWNKAKVSKTTGHAQYPKENGDNIYEQNN